MEWFKVGPELYTAAGPDAVETVLNRGGRVLLDLKYHDIPNTVAHSVAAAAALGVSMLTVHVAGGPDMLHAAVEATKARSHAAAPLILGITLLTSDPDPRAAATVLDRARAAQAAGLDGVVASGREVATIKAACGRTFVVATPGIRPTHAAPDDQRRTMTPSEAVSAGSDFLIVGRPITGAADPRAAAVTLLEDMRGT